MTNSMTKRRRGRPKGLRRVTRCTHGGFSKNPSEVDEYWQKHSPAVADFVDHIFEAFRYSLGWSEIHPLIHELRFLTVAIASRNLMHGEIIKNDFKMPVRDPQTHAIIRYRAHHLIEPVLAFDARIQQKLKDFGLIQSSRNKTRQMIKDFGLNQSSHNKNEMVIDNDKIKEGD